ncbi:asparagine synthase-related protein [Paenibacillus ihuae]|uniref:asparagine synthase-related protein n=1 Tax=Paenibacillus ihuae TaxID=1232431 RepID=UPI0006D563F0|nr:asparagine synthase-related protein [Paenibacillus ihuae]
MSVITGILNFHNDSAHEEGRNMIQALEQYPSDDTGTWSDQRIFLGCAARWITPESVNQPLPFYDIRHQLVITADAIIDNRKELFDRLQVDSGLRSSMSDSELILLAYLKWGAEVNDFLIGDYAFVIWDARKQLLFGSRDHLGNRTLYYSHDEQKFSFCTIIAPFFRIPTVHKHLNETWIADFLAIPGMHESNDASSTPYRNILQLPPAHSFTVKDRMLRITSSNNIILPAHKMKFGSSGEVLEAFQALFQEATAARLRTFRHVGATLSGGLDSGAVVSQAARALQTNDKILHTYSYVPPDDFEDWTGKSRMADERPYIKATVNHVGNIKDTYVNLPGQSPFTEIDTMLQVLEAPYKNFENSFWIKGIYERSVQDDVGVLLTGARGNYTISWGSAVNYCVHLLQSFRYLRFHQEMKNFSRQMGIRRAKLFPLLVKNAYPSLDRTAATQADFPLLISPEFAERTRVFSKLQEEQKKLTASVNNPMKDREAYFSNPSLLSLQGSFGARLSVRYGLWERDVTADLRLIRFCLSLPAEQYIHDGMGRALVRRATKHHLPDQVRLNQHIRGVQGVDWIHRMLPSWDDFRQELEELCSDPKAAHFLNTLKVKEILSSKGTVAKPEQAMDLDTRFLMRSLIVYRFLKAF